MVHEIPVDAVRCSDPTEEALKEREKTVITAGLGRAAPEVGTRGHAHLLNILFGLLPPLIVIRRQYISNFLRSMLVLYFEINNFTSPPSPPSSPPGPPGALLLPAPDLYLLAPDSRVFTFPSKSLTFACSFVSIACQHTNRE